MASIYDKSSLVLIPSGTKTGKVYSQVPTNGDGDFTFTRSSAATRVNADGNIEKETQNLLLQSNTFNIGYVLEGSATITGNQAGYDGTNNAWLLSKNSDWSHIYQNISQSGVWTASIYAKAGTTNWLALENSGIAGDTCYFDLSSGVTGSTGSGVIGSSIEDIGNGWYRCSVTINGTSIRQRIYPAFSNGNINGGNGNIYIQDFQLEQGLVARDYIETTTSAVYGGITDNVPRLDYTDSSCPALLLEPLRTNLMAYSEYFGVYNALNGASITSNYSASPEGYNNATRLQLNSQSLSRIEFSASGTSVANKSHSVSCWVKSNGADAEFRLKCTHSSVLDYFSPNLTATSEWQRFTFTQLFGAGASNSINAGILNGTSNNAADLSIYGFQLEQNSSYATSYIPTYGSSVTRGKDDCTLDDATSVIANAKGSFYIEGKIDFLDTNGIIALTAGIGTADLFYLWIRANGAVSAEWYNGVLQAAINSNTNLINVGDSFKMAVAYQDNDFVLYINGTLIGTDTSGNAPYPTLLRIGKYNVDNYTGGSYTNAMVFPTRLTNAELADLTTL